MGIVNGTTNYILTRMSEDGASYGDALAQAQDLGYAEPDPTADVEGADAAAKAAILASLAFGTWVGIDQVPHTGITAITAADIAHARNLGYSIKLLGIAETTPNGVSARVHPVLLPVAHPLSAIRGATNAIFIEGPSIDTLLFAGPGAGGEPTATAVLGDVIDAAREILAGAQVAPRIRFAPSALADFGTVPTKWYVRLEVVDEPGVLAQIAAAFGEAKVSIKSVWQEGGGDGATLLIVTHRAPEADQQRALAGVRDLDCVNAVAAAIRVESEES
jgi:homoserine dehydrogenase